MIQHSLNLMHDSIELTNPEIKEQRIDRGESFIKAIQNRVLKKDKNFICLVLGDTGSGKSFACLRLAERLDPNFNIDKVVFSKKEFMERIVNAKKGDAIVYEEAGVSLAARQWWKNFGSNVVMQTFRYKNLYLIMNCPVISFVDRNSISLVHATFKMMKIDEQRQMSTIRPILLDTDGQFNFTKKCYPLIDGFVIPKINVHIPSLLLRRAYEKKASKFKDDLSQGFLREEIAKEKALRFGEVK